MATYKVFFTSAGVPATGLSPTIPVLKRVDTQDDVTPPLVYEIGGGWYTFEHEPAEAQVGYVDGTATLAAADRYIPIDLNVEDVYLDAPVAVIDTVVDAVQAKTDNLPSDPADQSVLAGLINDVPTVAEFEARTLVAADYTVVSDLPVAPDNAGITALASAVSTLDGKVVVVDGIVDTIAVDVAGLDGAAMRGTDSALLASSYTAPANPDVSRLASIPVLSEIEASTVLAKDATVAKEASLAPLALEASLAPLALEASLASLALEASVQSVPTADENADAVWNELSEDHLTAGTTGLKLSVTTPESLANAVWDAPTIDHTTTGSTGAAILATISAIYPSATSIAAALWAKIVTGAVSAETALATLYNGWTSDAGVGSGAGAISSEITVTVGGAPSDGVEVWISTDIEGANVIAGTLITDAFGKATFMLDPGTYYLWKQRSGVNFTNPETIVVT